MRVLFAGTPEIARFSLERMIDDQGPEWTVVGVLTNPDAPKGRGRRVAPSPVKVRAQEAGLPILQPDRLTAEARAAVEDLKPHLLVVVAYGKIFGPKFLSLFPRGGINVHPSLLPRHRGPSPLQAAILAGDRETGVTIQYLAREMDAGDIIAQERAPIGSDTTVAELHDELGRRGAEMVVAAIRDIARGTVSATPQNEEAATYCQKLSRHDGDLTWEESAEEIHRKVRALTPWPGVRCRWGDTPVQFTETLIPDETALNGITQNSTPGSVLAVDSTLGILVQTTDGVLAVRRLKQHARKELDFRSFVNGNPEIIGSVLRQA
ncbi:MAG: methionyl-tRNA formyltransferase [Alkalispirochaeta sp.]